MVEKDVDNGRKYTGTSTRVVTEKEDLAGKKNGAVPIWEPLRLLQKVKSIILLFLLL